MLSANKAKQCYAFTKIFEMFRCNAQFACFSLSDFFQFANTAYPAFQLCNSQAIESHPKIMLQSALASSNLKCFSFINTVNL